MVQAAAKGNAEIMQLLLSVGVVMMLMPKRLSSAASFGRNPITIAASNGNSECLKLLLDE